MEKFGTIAFWHERLNSNKKDHGLDLSLYDSFSEMAQKEFGEFDVYRAIYMKEHHGLQFSTISFANMKGSVQVGFIFARKNEIRRRFGKVDMCTMLLAEALLFEQVEELNNEFNTSEGV